MVTYKFSVLKVNKKNPLLAQNPFYGGQKHEIVQHMGVGIPRTVGYAESQSEAKKYIKSHGKSKGINVKFI